MLDAQIEEFFDDDPLKKDAFRSVLWLVGSLSPELPTFHASFLIFKLFIDVLCYQVPAQIMSYVVVFVVIRLLDTLLYLAF